MAQNLVNGLFMGGLYALTASGLTLIFGVMRVINIAHGEFLMLGAYISFFLFDLYGIHPLFSLPIAMAILFALGLITQRVLIHRVVGAPELASLLLCFGLSILIVNLALYLFKADYRSIPVLSGSLPLWGLSLSEARLVAFLIALSLSVTMFAFLKFTRLGKAIRAVSQNREAALTCNIDVRKIDMLAFGIGVGLVAASGALFSFVQTIYPGMGGVYTLKSFFVIVLGGMGNFVGAFMGGLILGLIEAVATIGISPQAAEALTYLLLIVILLARPMGLLGVRTRKG
mgnify:CR=1 FL=1